MKNILLASENARNFWENNFEIVENFYSRKILDPAYPLKIPVIRFNTTNKLEILIRMEKKFVSTILSKVNLVLNSTNKKVALLFDIDDTLGVSRIPEIEPTIFRPSAAPLIKLLKIYSPVGILSNRLALNRCDLYEIYDLLDTSMIFSSRDAIIINKLATKKIYDDLLSKGKISLTDKSNLNKLVRLETLRQAYKDYFFVVVDDLPYANEIGMHGIYINQYLQCYL